MTRRPRSFRWAVRIIPGRWRESVERDLLEEAARSGRQGLRLGTWLTIQTLTIAFALAGRSFREWWRTRPLWRSALEGVGLDVRLAWRTMARQPWSTAAIVMILALGLSASTAAFALFNHVLFRPIPGIANPDELATVYFQPAGRQSTYFSAAHDALEAFRSAGTFVALGSSSESELLVVPRTGADAELVEVEVVTDGYLDALRVRARAGRLLTPDDFAARRSVALISERWWRSRFTGDASVIGQSISISGHPVVIAGVVADYRGWGALRIGTIDIWIPADAPPVPSRLKSEQVFSLVGRLRPDVPIAIAEEQLRARFAPYESSVRMVMSMGVMSTARPIVPVVYPGLSAIGEARTRGAVAEMYPFALGASGLLLLLACANTANLLLARTMAQARDLALRHAIGAGRWRLARGLLVEAGLIAVSAIGLGLVIGRLLVGFVQGEQLFQTGPALDEVFLDWRVVVFATALGGVTILLYGVAPAFAASQSALPRALAQTHRSTRASRRLRGGLVCVQLALAMTLLAGGGVLVRSLQNLRHADLGMQPEGVVTFGMNPMRLDYDGERQFGLVRDTIAQLRSAPGIESVAFSSPSPFWSGRVPASLKIEPTEQAPEHAVSRAVVSADYFSTLGIPLRAGRVFAETEFERARRKEGVGIVNESLARHLFGGASAVGRRIYLSRAARGWELDRSLNVIGVVGDTRGSNLRQPGGFVVYEPAGANIGLGAFFVRSRLAAAETVSTARTTVRRLEPNLPLAGAGSVRDEIDRLLPRERMLALLISGVALLATILGVAGVHAVIAHTVAERAREFGIRLALGASRAAVSAGVLGSVAGLALAGLAAGVAIFAAASRLLESHVYGISPLDPVTLFAVGLLLVIAALAGAWVPARRATRVDPAAALRME